jgi:hypothetical protein
MSVCPNGTSRLPLNGFLLNLIFEDFNEIGMVLEKNVKNKMDRYIASG